MADNDDELFGSDDEKPTPAAAAAAAAADEDDDNLFGEEEVKTVVSRGGGRKSTVLRDEDDDDEDGEGGAGGGGEMDVSKGESEGGAADNKDELDDLFGEDEGGGSSSSSSTKARSTSSLRITRTYQVPDNCQAVLVRMPNVLKIQPEPFNADTYNKEDDMEALGRMAMGIRWRHKVGPDGERVMGANGQPEMESNARLVKLKSGGMQILVGGEAYDYFPQPVEHSFVYMQKASRLDEDRKTALELVGQVSARATIQPTSITAASRKLIAKTLKQETKKVKRVETVRIQDQALQRRPEEMLQAMAKEEEAKIKMLRKQRSDRDDRQPTNRIRMSADYLNAGDEGEYDTTNLSDIRQGRKQPARRRGDDDEDEDTSEDDDDEDDDLDGFIVKSGAGESDSDPDDGPRYFRKAGSKPKPKAAKKPKAAAADDEEESDGDDSAVSEEEDEDDGEDDEDEDEEEEEAPKKKSKKRPKSPSSSSAAAAAAAAASTSSAADEEEDAESEPAERTNKRRKQVIDDDDDE